MDDPVMLADAISEALPQLRAEAEALMVDHCTIKRATGEVTTDPVTLEEVPAYAPVWAGQCRIQRPGGVGQQDEVAGEHEYGVATVLGQLPLSATGITRGDRLTVDAIGPATDPDLLGLVATVGANLTKTHPTKRTLVCEEVAG